MRGLLTAGRRAFTARARRAGMRRGAEARSLHARIAAPHCAAMVRRGFWNWFSMTRS